ncbi:hypothetical protein [uncultured Sphingomonas sp.]|uniref:hypothetical protein n=1 Tax=uncultured Sphingomonas sp. TaxID=158754 RepID=UPI0035CB12E5
MHALSPFRVLGMLPLAMAVAPSAGQTIIPRGNLPPAAVAAPAYADIADLVTGAPMVIDATVRDTTRIRGAEAASVAQGYQRLYVTVDVVALIRAPAGAPARLGYVYDVPLDAAGRIPKLRKARVLLFARPVAGRIDQIQLVEPDAQIGWTPPAEAMTRAIAAAFAAPDAAPRVTGIGNAFHTPGTLPGEGETQIFLTTTGGPVSIGIQRRQDQPPTWAVALNEIVDQALPPPARDTFLWYRLACGGLPAALPDAIMAGDDPANAAIAREDYRLVRRALGPCRTGTAG